MSGYKFVARSGSGLLLGVVLGGCAATISQPPTATRQSSLHSTPVAVIRAARINVDGVTRTVFTDRAGRTLYWFTFDRPGRVACTTQCARAWNPLLTHGDALDLPTGLLLGSFQVVRSPNGRQVEYEGHPLYTSDQDTGPHQANGQGFEDAWYVATLDLAPGSW